jgi:hypothetical protein
MAELSRHGLRGISAAQRWNCRPAGWNISSGRGEDVCDVDNVDPGAQLARGFAIVLVEAEAQSFGTAGEMLA